MTQSLSQTLLIAAVIGLGAVGISSMDAEAAPRGPDAGQHEHSSKTSRRGGKAKMFVKAVQQLDLSPDQQSTVDKVKTEMKAERAARKEQRGERGERGERLEALLDGSLSEASVHASIDERAARKTARAHQDAEWIFEILDVLTPAQKRELKSVIEMKQAERASASGNAPAKAGPRSRR